MKKTSAAISIVLIMICGLVGCKPSEKNFQAAYDIAIQRQKEGLSDEIFAMMQKESLPPLYYAGGDSVRMIGVSTVYQYSPDTLLRMRVPAPYSVAVGKYKMIANARGHADRLVASGLFPAAHVLRSGVPEYYVVLAPSDSLADAARLARQYLESGMKAIGLPEPFVINRLR